MRPTSLLVLFALLLTACGPSPSPSEGTGDRRPIIIDTDLDVSDVAAVAALLLDPQLDVRAVTVAATGTGVTNCAAGRAVVEYLLAELDRSDVPSACGRTQAGPDAIPFPPEWRTAADTGWGIEMPSRPRSEVPGTAVDLLLEAVARAPRPPTVVALGPWTNLEDALAADPAFGDGVAGIHAMAATIDAPGNVFTEELDADDRLEWNVAADPSAFTALFATDVPIVLVPLDATDDVPVAPTFADRLAESTAAGANLAYELFLRVPGRVGEGQQLWDELAALAFMDDGVVTWEEMTLEVTPAGRLDRSDAGRPVRVATAADAAATETALVSALERGPDRAQRFAVAGELRVSWDGTTCSIVVDDPPQEGVSRISLENTSGAPTAAVLVAVEAPHEWSELQAFIAGVDVTDEGVEPPAWAIDRAYLADEGGSGTSAPATAVLEPGLHGPVCMSGQWPDVTLVPGEPLTIGSE